VLDVTADLLERPTPRAGTRRELDHSFVDVIKALGIVVLVHAVRMTPASENQKARERRFDRPRIP